MDLLRRTVEEVGGGRVFELLPEAAREDVAALSEEQLRDGAWRALTRPMPGDTAQSARLLLNPCLTVQWLAAFEELKLPPTLRVFEPCAGGSEPVIYAAELYTNGRGSYVTLNLNRPLAAELRGKLGKVRMDARVIEDNTLNAAAHLEPGTFDVACFHHAINDILQTAVAEPRGMDTRTVDWWPNERQMIEWLADDAANGRLDERARPALVEAVRAAIELVGAGGWILFDHWTWESHRSVQWLPWELYCDLVPLARRWIAQAGLPVEERPLAGRDARWWMCLRVR
ncbi:MAG: hypothetical protein IT208_02245 [Chthonomonadales bacterium]|nr:hypothetical protein [Chthonomonadales bacterium]